MHQKHSRKVFFKMNFTEKHIAELVEAPVFKAVGQAAKSLGCKVYVVGGFVRDGILGRPLGKDLDFVTVGSGIALAKAVAQQVNPKTKVAIFKTFGTAQLHLFGQDLEFVGARTESYSHDSRKPAVEAGTLQDDQNRRDFTINAMAISLNEEDYGTLLDPFDGVQHLQQRLIKTPLAPGITFSDDPLRMMRAIRFAAQLNFEIDTNALEAITENAQRLQIISAERIADEFNKIMSTPVPSVGLALLFKTKLLHQFFPELIALYGVDEVDGHLHKDNFYHTLKVVDNICPYTDNLWLRWAALLHDVGKPVTKKFIEPTGWTFYAHEFVGSKMVSQIFKRLKLPLNEKMKYVQKIVRLSSRPIALIEETVSDSAVRRLLFEAGEDIDDLMTLCEADITTKNDRKRLAYLQNFELVRQKIKEVEEKDHLRNWQPPIDGDLIKSTFGLGQGKEVGDIKNAIREAILDGNLTNSYDAAFTFMIHLGKKMGLQPVNA